MEKIAEKRKTMSGIYKRTKKHREEFSKNMHSPIANKKRQETRKKNRELAEKKTEEEREIPVKEKTNKFDGFDNRIESLDRDELADKLISVRDNILAKVKELAKIMETIKNLQKRRDRLEIRLAELGMRF